MIWMIRSTQTFLTVKLSPIEVIVLQTLANYLSINQLINQSILYLFKQVNNYKIA